MPTREYKKSVTPTTEMLGTHGNEKLLIIHADDLGVAHSVNRATFTAFETGCISSASLMMPCPWVAEVSNYVKSHPEFDIGVHLTLTSEWRAYRWGPVAPRRRVASLLDADGYLWSDSKQAARHCRIEEVEYEIRAQVDRALELGIRPTHLDSHMFMLFETPQLFLALVKVARDYGIPYLAVSIAGLPKEVRDPVHEGDILLDRLIALKATTPSNEWSKWYAQALTELEPGLTQLIVHLGYDDAELRAVTAGQVRHGSSWRQRDFHEVSSKEFRESIQEKEIKLVSWKDLKQTIR